jgi:hypothetical protein
MAITQTRMIALLTIAETFKNELLARQRGIADILSEVPPDAPRESLLRAAQLIQTYNSELSLPPAALDTLATERAHFKLHASRNDRLARKARQRRGSPIDAPSTTAPDKITPRSSIFPPKGGGTIITPASALAAQKLSYNAQYARYNMPAPYLDPYNDAEGLLPEHGGTPESDPDNELF